MLPEMSQLHRDGQNDTTLPPPPVLKRRLETLGILTWRHDIQHDATRHSDTRYNSRVIMLSVVVVNFIMLSVIMLSFVMLWVIMLSVAMLSSIMLSVVMLSLIMLSVAMLSVVKLSIIM